jgi:hypothetical protein
LEFATTLRISGRAAQRRMAFAITLTERLPRRRRTTPQVLMGLW